jgi:stress response protein SCP2
LKRAPISFQYIIIATFWMLALMHWVMNLPLTLKRRAFAAAIVTQRHCYAPIRRRRMSQNLAELAETAITAMKALNTELKRQQSEWAMSRYGKHFAGNGVSLSDQPDD